MFISNAFNLIAVLEQTEPLVYSFKNDRDFLGRKKVYRISTQVLATFLPDQSGSKVFFTVKTNPTLYILGVLMSLSLLVNLYYGGPIVSNILFIILLLAIIPIDMYSKRDILNRAISVVTQTA
jgi:hypothetical protein